MARPSLKKPRTLLTPLGIIAAFLSLTEVVLGLALTRVTGPIQIALATFVMVFPVLIAAAFFYILWHRAYVFYAPSEYGNVNPSDFMSAMRDAPLVVSQVNLAKSLEENPFDVDARFSLIDSMAEDSEIQCAIFMYESEKDLPPLSSYVYGYKGGVAGSGDAAFATRRQLQGAGIVRPAGGGGWGLTEEGKRFAAWLIKRQRKCDYFWTQAGGWGTFEPGSREEKYVQDAKTRAEQWQNEWRKRTRPVPLPQPTATSDAASEK
jgi:hypothetical protein